MTESANEELRPEDAASALLEAMTVATLKDSDQIFVYQNGVYVLGGEPEIKAKLKRTVEPCTTRFVDETINHVKRRTYVSRDEFDGLPYTLNVTNGLLNLETFEFLPHDPDFLSVVQLPVGYDPLASCPRIKQFLDEVLYPDDIPVFQEWVGYCLWRGYPAQKALLLTGEGNNGKSTALSLIKALLGIRNISTRGLQELELNRFAKADLYGKLANIYADLTDTALRATGVFKMLTGGDPLTAEYKFRNGFSFVNYGKLLFSANKVPEVFEDTVAYFRRWIILTFPNRFDGEKEDTGLLAKLTTPQEMSGFLNFAIEGLKRLLANNWHFSDSRSTEEVRLEYIRKSSPINAFLMDCVIDDPSGKEPKQDCYKAFVEYCDLKKLPKIGDQAFFRNIYKYRPKLVEERPTIMGRRRPCFVGIRIKERAKWGVTEEDDNPADSSTRTSPDSPDTLDGQLKLPVNPVKGSGYLGDRPENQQIVVGPAQALCANCGKLLGRAMDRTIFNHDEKTFCLEHLPRDEQGKTRPEST